MRRSGRTQLFSQVAASLRKSLHADEGLTRRSLLRAAVPATFGMGHVLRGASIDVGIVGAGLAGLSCAYELRRAGIVAPVYEASTRAGGRCYSLRGVFPGQVAERGGEFIDNLHKTMLRYAKEFGLTLEDVGKMPGEVFYHFDGALIPEARVVEEFRSFVSAMRTDLRSISAEPTADSHSPSDQAFDRMSLKEYLQTRGAGRIASKAIEEAYVAEYGREIDEQSCLNFLLFIHADRRSKFTPFGVFSDERYHVVEGNNAIATGLASRLPSQIRLAKSLTEVRKLPSGKVQLTFSDRTTAVHEAVVLTLPFSVLRNVAFRNFELPKWKADAIQQLGYGDNAKTMIAFRSPFWRTSGSNGTAYSDLLNLQNTWETNPSRASAAGAVLTDYAGGERGRMLNPSRVQEQVSMFLGDLDRVYAGALTSAVQSRGRYLAYLEHWPSNPLTRGSYTCYLPGQFTSIGGNEAKSVGNIFFAGEHTNSFYEWQGFMEGALLSGITAAAQLTAKR